MSEDSNGISIELNEMSEDPLEVYLGESDIKLSIIFDRDVINLTIRYNCSLIMNNRSISEQGPFLNGSKIDIAIPINSSSLPGTYIITIRLSYNYTDGLRDYYEITRDIQYLKAIEILSIHLPENNDPIFRISFRMLVEFRLISIIFDADGDIEVENKEYLLNRLKVGNYTYGTSLHHIEAPRSEQRINYQIIAYREDKSIILSEDYYEINIEFNDITLKSNENIINKVIIVLLIISVLIIFNYLYLFRKK
ncbi:MAG: hypothetical protein ACXADH_04500 [Candidatus Kariarchaeaceae archaeon]|jgi:hypothetical protein